MNDQHRPDAASPARDKASVAAVRELETVVGWLAASLLPGTGRPYQAPQMSAEKRAELDAQARLHRAVTDIGTGTMLPLGESPAPMDLHVADLLSEVLEAAVELADLVSVTALVARMPEAQSAFNDPAPYLLHVVDLLPACRHEPRVARRVVDVCEGLVFRARSALGLMSDGQLLPFECPWCGGRTSRHPVGGARTLRVRLMPSKHPVTGVDEQVPVVTCEGGLCEPPEADVGHWLRGRPAWPLEAEGAWLAARIERSMAS